MRRYDAILFDLDGTIRTDQPDGIEMFIECASQIGIPLTAAQTAQLEREAHRYWASGALVDQHMARYDQRGFWSNYYALLLGSLGVKDSDLFGERVHECFEQQHDPDDMVFADTWRVLNCLKAGGHVLGLVSNRDKPVDGYIESIGLGGLFDFVLVGGQAGCYKPDAGIFQHALKLAGVPAGRALYVGDNYFADVIGATGVGMDALLIDRRGVFESEYDRRVRHLRDVLGHIGDAV